MITISSTPITSRVNATVRQTVFAVMKVYSIERVYLRPPFKVTLEAC